MVLSELVEFGPWFSAETVKACALIGLHMMSEENSKKYGLGRPWPRRRFCEHTVDDLAIEVVGQHWTNEAISLFHRRLGGRAGAIKLPLVNGPLCVKK